MGEAAKIMSISVDFSVPQKNHTSMLPTASAFKLLHLNDQSSAAFLWVTTYLSQNARLTPRVKSNQTF